MPSYKTHAIHGEMLLPEINNQVKIDIEALKAFSMGPDALILTDYNLFELQHVRNTRRYFKTLIKLIKHNKLQDNSESMAFLYGQIDHFILDMIMHPLIYYMTDNMPKEHILDPHGLIENLIDDYVVQKYDKNEVFYYHKVTISDRKLIKLINDAYEKVYHSKNISFKYSMGMILINIYDSLIRRDKFFLAKSVLKLINFGDVTYHNNYNMVLPYLNLEHNLWLNPETGEENYASFDDLWEKASEVALETIQDVNNYLYRGKKLKNPIILNDTSFNTGLPCSKGQTKKFVKKYIRR